MKYVFITFSGLGLPIAYKLSQAGFEVNVGIIEDIKDYCLEEEAFHTTESDFNKKRRLQLFKGLLKTEDAHKTIEKLRSVKDPENYFVFFEENNLYRWADKVRDLPCHGNFPTKEDYLFEVDRDRAKQFVKKHYSKLYVPEVEQFDKVNEAKKFLEKSDQIWVLKGKDDSAKTFVPDTPDPDIAKAQIIEMLDNFPEKYEKLGFILELFIPQIIELTPEKFYYDGVPLGVTIDIENKNFASGNNSVQTGCSEDLVFPIGMEERIAKIAFPEIIDEMAKQHKGLFIWDASLLINKRDGKIYFGEFCSNRPGYNSLFSEMSQCGPVNEFFESIIAKKNPYTLGTVSASVRLFNLNRDPESEQLSSGITLNFRSEIEKDIWMWDAKKDGDKFVSVGYDWNLAVVTGTGKSIEEAVSKLYRNIENFSFVGSYYRSKDDYLSLDYPTSILNRLNYGMERGLYSLPFNVKVGDIK